MYSESRPIDKMEEYKIKWNRCLDKIRSNLGEDRFQVWFSCAKVVSYKNNELLIQVPSYYYKQQYESTFLNLIASALRSEFGAEIQLFYTYQVIEGDKKSNVVIQSQHHAPILVNKTEQIISSKQAMVRKELIADSQLNSSLNFENYCVGRVNRLPFTIAEHIANYPEKPDFNPFFLYGSVGVGKTHLIQAIGIRIKERNPRAKVLFISMRQFQNYFQQAAVINKNIPEFINWFQGLDVILFDDLQELSGKTGTCDALFPIFQHLHQNNKKLVFTCDRPPMELDGIADRLIDRFKWGITEELEKPDYELRRKILKFKAQTNGLDLSDDIIDFIACSSTGSVRELEGIVMGLYTRSIAENAPLTVALAEKVISHFVKKVEKKAVNFDMIVENTAEFYHLNPDAIFSKSRLRDIADARQMIMYLCKKHTGLSSPAIGSKLNRKHATVLHGISAIADRLEVSKELNDAVAAIEKSMLG